VRKKKRKSGRPKLLTPEDEDTLRDFALKTIDKGRYLRDKKYAMDAWVSLTDEVGIRPFLGLDEDFVKFKNRFPSVIIGSGWDNYALKWSLLTELGRWEPEARVALCDTCKDYPVKEAIKWMRAIRLDPKRHETFLVIFKFATLG
jgi:hypothetical protein